MIGSGRCCDSPTVQHVRSPRIARQRIDDGRDPTVALTWAYGLIGTLHFVTLWWLRDRTCSSQEIANHLTDLLWSGIGGPA